MDTEAPNFDWNAPKSRQYLVVFALVLTQQSQIVELFSHIWVILSQHLKWNIKLQKCFKAALSALMLCTPVFILTSGSSALSGHPLCGLSVWLSLLAIFICNTTSSSPSLVSPKPSYTVVQHLYIFLFSHTTRPNCWAWLPPTKWIIRKKCFLRRKIECISCHYHKCQFLGIHRKKLMAQNVLIKYEKE